MSKTFESLIYAILTRRNDIRSVVMSRDVMSGLLQGVQNGEFEYPNECFSIEVSRELYHTVGYRGAVVNYISAPMRMHMYGIPIQISLYANTCYIELDNGEIIELLPSPEEWEGEELTFEVEDLERIWHGGF